MRFLALDVGDRRIGVALSDETALLASPHSTIERVGPKKDVRAVALLCQQHEVVEVVVGLPMKLDGTLGPQAEKTLEFVDALRRSLQQRVPVVTWDERFTTVIAQRALIEADMSRRDRREVVDKVSAAVLLQGWLDARRAGGLPPAAPGA